MKLPIQHAPPYDDQTVLKELGEETLRSIEDAVTRGFVMAHSQGSATSQVALEKLLVTLLAATVSSGHLPRSGEGRAEELAELLIKAVREANHLREAEDDL